MEKNVTFSFLNGKERDAQPWFYANFNDTGLGLVNVSDFVTGLQSAWVKKALLKPCDNWCFDISTMSGYDFFKIPKAIPDRVNHPIYFNLMGSFGRFLESFHLTSENYTKMPIFHNSLIKRSKDDNGIIDENFLGIDNTPLTTRVLRGATFADFAHNRRMRSLHEINTNLGLDLSLVTYIRIGQALTFFISKLKVNRHSDGSAISLPFFLNRFAKSSQPFRKTLSNMRKPAKKLLDLPVVITYYNLIELEKGEEALVKRLHCTWAFHFFPIRIREFAFKFLNNSLGLNTRISNFVENVDRSCSLCTAGAILPPCKESFLHLFFHCKITSNLQNEFLNKSMQSLAESIVSEDDRKKLWFEFHNKNNQHPDLLLSATLCLFQGTIWEFKLKKKAPSYTTFMNEFALKLNAMISASVTLKYLKNENINNFSIFRD